LPVTARCPQCQTLYRISREKIAPTGSRLRCTRCKTVFRVEPPPEPEIAKRDIESLERVAPEAPAPPAPTPAQRVRALVADSDPARAKAVADYLSSWQIEPEVVLGGSEALLGIFRSPPALAILGGHLPGVAAPAIVEVARRSAGLAYVSLVRIAPADEPALSPEFEADQMLEPADLPEGLGPILDSLGIGIRPAPAPRPTSPSPAAPAPERPAAAPPVVPIPPDPEPLTQPHFELESTPPPAAPALTQPEPRVAPVPSGPQAPGAPEETDPEIAAAERLARIAVSDIILYNEEKFRIAAAAGTLPDALSGELDEARSLFRNRVSDELRGQRDFLVEELMARAARL
jgi:predicted Zn finger-like uncharacterized protein